MINLLQNIKTLDLEYDDLDHIPPLTPSDWYDISVTYRSHFYQDFFFPVKMVFNEKIIGIGELIINDKIGWLGMIVIEKSFRGKGLGTILTEHLIQLAKKENCESIFLLATPLGEPVYKKLGFQTDSQYLFFVNESNVSLSKNYNNIFPFQPKDESEVFTLDQIAMGENRSEVLKPHLEKGWVLKENEKVEGFFLPTLGNGLVIANNDSAGFQLLEKKESLGQTQIVLPEQNQNAIQFLKEKKYTHYRTATFMFLGKMKKWNPEMVYCRIGGYIG